MDYSIWEVGTEYTVNPEEFASMGKATPFAGMKAYGKCLFNVAGGKTVWNALDGE